MGAVAGAIGGVGILGASVVMWYKSSAGLRESMMADGTSFDSNGQDGSSPTMPDEQIVVEEVWQNDEIVVEEDVGAPNRQKNLAAIALFRDLEAAPSNLDLSKW
jgi:hypothetical protein